MKSKSFGVKVLLVALSLLAFLVICEIGLRIGGQYYLGGYRLSEDELKKLSDVDIVCIGNSHTAGVGAPEGESFCHYLQEMGELGGYEFKTQNWGVPLYNTSDILKDIKKKIPPASPKIALVMAGEPNFVNFRGFSEYKDRRFGARDKTAKSSAMELFMENSALFKLYLLLKKDLSSEETFGPDGQPFKVINPENSLEVAYRWLSWARANYPDRGLSDQQAEALLESIKIIKATDPSNLAADLVASEVQALHLQNPGRGLEILRSIPKSHEACLAFIEGPAVERLGSKLPYFLQKKIKGPASTDFIQFVSSLKARWRAKLTVQERTFLDKVLNRNSYLNDRSLKPLDANILDRSKSLRKIFETLSDCGAIYDLPYVFLHFSYMRTGDFENAFNISLRQVQNFPLTPYADAWQWLNIVKTLVKDSSQAEQKIAEMKQMRLNRFGDLAGENSAIPTAVIAEWTEYELREIAQTLEDVGTEVIFMTYPPFPFRGRHPIKKTPIVDMPNNDVDDQIRNVVGAGKYRLFDTYSRLRKRFMESDNSKKFYSFGMGKMDPHLNAAGYKSLAEELFGFLESENLISKFKK